MLPHSAKRVERNTEPYTAHTKQTARRLFLWLLRRLRWTRLVYALYLVIQPLQHFRPDWPVS